MVTKKQANRDIFRLILPAVFENILQIMASMVATAMVGRLAADDISAQGISNRLVQIAWALFRGLSTGATVIVGYYYGQGRLDKCRRAIEQAYLALVPTSLIMAVIMFTFSHELLSLFTNDQLLIAKAESYLRIAVWMAPFSAVMLMNTAAFNGRGDTKTPMYIAVFYNIINMIACYIFIYGGFGMPALNINGAAVASIISNVFGCSAGLFMLYRRRGLYCDAPRTEPFFKFDFSGLKRLVTTGLPASGENLLWQFSAIVLSRAILTYGSNYYAAYQLGMQTEMFFDAPSMGFVVASTALCSYAIGKKDKDLFQLYFRQMRKFSFWISAVITVALLSGSSLVMGLLTDKPEIQAIGIGYIMIMGFAQIPQGLSKVYNGAIRSAGYPKFPMYNSFIGIWLVRVPVSLLAAYVFKVDIMWVWVAISLDQIVRISSSMIFFKRKKIFDLETVMKP